MRMKRLFLFLIFSLCLVSCELQVGSINKGTADELQIYTMDAFSGHVIMPVMMAELAVDLDAYLSLSDEEKVSDFRFYGNIRNTEPDVYMLELEELVCTVKVDGKSIWDEGAQWTFLSFRAETDLNGRGSLYCSTSERIVLESHPAASGDESVRLFSMLYGDAPVGMVLCSYEGRQFEWNVGTNGVNDDGDGYQAEYTTGADGIRITKRYNDSLGGYEYICDGDFLVTVFRDNEPIDMCKAVFRPGLKAQFITGK